MVLPARGPWVHNGLAGLANDGAAVGGADAACGAPGASHHDASGDNVAGFQLPGGARPLEQGLVRGQEGVLLPARAPGLPHAAPCVPAVRLRRGLHHLPPLPAEALVQGQARLVLPPRRPGLPGARDQLAALRLRRRLPSLAESLGTSQAVLVLPAHGPGVPGFQEACGHFHVRPAHQCSPLPMPGGYVGRWRGMAPKVSICGRASDEAIHPAS
mmetsp:Transcript_50592/g.156590  ORF Transcript_50592/g.156590 Transcript_50592/m.156590 type:complete len:214 (-) Transcript_50592:12-653(-)